MESICEKCMNLFVRKYIDTYGEKIEMQECLMSPLHYDELEVTIECTHYESEESDIEGLN